MPLYREATPREIDAVCALGEDDMRLHVWHFNERALRLYGELGYEVRSHQLGKPLDGIDA